MSVEAAVMKLPLAASGRSGERGDWSLSSLTVTRIVQRPLWNFTKTEAYRLLFRRRRSLDVVEDDETRAESEQVPTRLDWRWQDLLSLWTHRTVWS